jgi:light-regulated signal transduction histidine kinase (bacteriophytochrome)
MSREVLKESNLELGEQEWVTTLRASDASVINHDLKSAISPIKICVEMLESHIPGQLNEKQARMIVSIHRCTDKLEKLIIDFPMS